MKFPFRIPSLKCKSYLSGPSDLNKVPLSGLYALSCHVNRAEDNLLIVAEQQSCRAGSRTLTVSHNPLY